MYRLFVAIDLPDDVRNAVAGICRDLPDARRVPAEQLHLTLRFIGDADEAAFRRIREALASVRGEPFPVALRGVGHFPPGRRARVIWVGVEGGEPLVALQRQVEAALAAAGVPPEERPFSPHITLARLREPNAEGTDRFEARHRGFASPVFIPGEFRLYSSLLTPKGAIHTVQADYPLRKTTR